MRHSRYATFIDYASPVRDSETRKAVALNMLTIPAIEVWIATAANPAAASTRGATRMPGLVRLQR